MCSPTAASGKEEGEHNSNVRQYSHGINVYIANVVIYRNKCKICVSDYDYGYGYDVGNADYFIGTLIIANLN